MILRVGVRVAPAEPDQATGDSALERPVDLMQKLAEGPLQCLMHHGQGFLDVRQRHGRLGDECAEKVRGVPCRAQNHFRPVQGRRAAAPAVGGECC